MTPGGTKITVLTFLKDEEHILPFFLRHYDFADRIIAFDNGSRDRSRDILSADPRVEIRDWDSGGELRDDQLVQMKNEEYRKTGEGWNFIVDADEFVYHNDILRFLDWCDSMRVTIPMTEGFDMVSQNVPADDGKSKLVDLVKDGRKNELYNKVCVVRHTCLINYLPGAHCPKDIGGWAMSTDQFYLKLLHYRYLSKDLVQEKAIRIKLSEYNRRTQTALQQANPHAMAARWEEAWRGKTRVLP